VPQRAVLQGAKSHFVWVVDNDSKAHQRVVEVGEWHGDDWFITDGLQAGERVVVDGAIRVSADVPLKIVAAPAAPATPASPAALNAPAGGNGSSKEHPAATTATAAATATTAAQ